MSVEISIHNAPKMERKYHLFGLFAFFEFANIRPSTVAIAGIIMPETTTKSIKSSSVYAVNGVNNENKANIFYPPYCRLSLR
jgi:hypothetical protein